VFWSKNSKDIEDKIDKIADTIEKNDKETDVRLDNIEKVLITQEMNLKEHMRRSDHLENIVESMQVKREAEIAPIKKHINMVEGVFKFLGILGIVVSILGGIAKLIGFI